MNISKSNIHQKGQRLKDLNFFLVHICTFSYTPVYFNFYIGDEKQKWRLNPMPIKYRFQLCIEWILYAFILFSEKKFFFISLIFRKKYKDRSSFYWNESSYHQITKLIMTLSVLKQNQDIQYAWKEKLLLYHEWFSRLVNY